MFLGKIDPNNMYVPDDEVVPEVPDNASLPETVSDDKYTTAVESIGTPRTGSMI